MTLWGGVRRRFLEYWRLSGHVVSTELFSVLSKVLNNEVLPEPIMKYSFIQALYYYAL